MEKFIGKWQTQPKLTENFDAFADKMGVEPARREIYKNMDAVYTFSMDGKTLVGGMETKGFKQDVRFELGVPVSYKSFDGANMTSCITMKDGRFFETNKMEREGTTREWTTERYIEGGFMVGVQTKDGVSMKIKLKKL
ncbi:fatty acid-binding protein-like [Haliotis rubra]|uniref:fatty acid-binding protein-like n=1 Tax=Haliotis rubra TaxID=36100 RepID=UPI001EE5E125|nr:fatty acid-binding protein-like [Haliotis rubra]